MFCCQELVSPCIFSDPACFDVIIISCKFDLLQIFRTLGTPNEKIWPEFPKLPGAKANFVKQP